MKLQAKLNVWLGSTVGFRFLKPTRETKISARNWEFEIFW